MFIPFGILTAGQADVVDKRFSVATEFFHIFWVAFLPVGSCVIVDRPVAKRFGLAPPTEAGADSAAHAGATPPEQAPAADDAQGDDQELDEQDAQEYRYPIPMSFKSVVLGYLRAWGFWITVAMGFLGGMLALMSGEDPEAAQMYPGFLIAAGIGLVVAIGSYYGPWNRATPRRALDLCDAIGMDPQRLPNDLRQQAAVDRR